MGAGAGDKQVDANYHVTMKIDGVDGALLFYSFTPPSMSWRADLQDLDRPERRGRHTRWAAAARRRGPTSSSPGAWTPTTPCSLWFEDVATKGAQEAKKDVVITVLDNANQPIRVWNLIGAVITQYNHSAVNAQTNEILVETITLKCQDCKVTKSG